MEFEDALQRRFGYVVKQPVLVANRQGIIIDCSVRSFNDNNTVA